MTAIAEWFVLRVATAAKRNHRTPSQSESVACRVLDKDVVPKYAIRAVVYAYDLSIILIAHQLPPLRISKQVGPVIVAHRQAARKPLAQRQT